LTAGAEGGSRYHGMANGVSVHELKGAVVDCARFVDEGRDPPTDSVATGRKPHRARDQEFGHSFLGIGGPAVRRDDPEETRREFRYTGSDRRSPSPCGDLRSERWPGRETGPQRGGAV
jgi:hypothetical protein